MLLKNRFNTLVLLIHYPLIYSVGKLVWNCVGVSVAGPSVGGLPSAANKNPRQPS